MEIIRTFTSCDNRINAKVYSCVFVHVLQMAIKHTLVCKSKDKQEYVVHMVSGLIDSLLRWKYTVVLTRTGLSGHNCYSVTDQFLGYTNSWVIQVNQV